MRFDDLNPDEAAVLLLVDDWLANEPVDDDDEELDEDFVEVDLDFLNDDGALL